MFGFRNYSITKKLVAMNMLVTASALLLAGGAFSVYYVLSFRSSMVGYLSSQATIIGSNSVSALLFNDPHSAELTLSAFRSSANIRYAAIYKPDGHPFVGYWSGPPGQFLPLLQIPTGQKETHRFDRNRLMLAQLIEFRGQVVGAVCISSDLSTLTTRLRRYEEIVAIVLLLSFLAALGVAWAFQRTISKPLKDLAETARAISRDRNYSVRASLPVYHDEVATLIAAFNEMLEQIQQRDLALQQSRDTMESRVNERTADLSRAQENLRSLSRRLMQMQDEERRRIARELHEGSSQVLAALTMNLSLLRTRVHAWDPAAIAIVNDSIHMADDILKDLRTMSYLLHPPLLEESGLESALRWFVDGFSQRSQIQVELDIERGPERLPREVEIAAFRVIQECLTNIHRHSGSKSASIHLTQDERNLCLEIQDYGKGIARDPAWPGEAPPGVGIQGMRERVQQLGGRFEIRSQFNEGTTVIATIPLQRVFADSLS